jgi:tRNA (adenine22-N1)-methyltransferase
MKLNKRLLALSEMVMKPYDIAWDCCCDHGLLGFKILADGLVKHVNFVDVVPDITQHLQHKLTTYEHHLPSDISWNVLCEDVGKLTLFDIQQTQACNDNQLVIISGVGGELMIEMLNNLMARYKDSNIDFLLCPVQHTYKLRSTLIKLNFKLISEQLVVENNRGYELILVNQVGVKNIKVTGSELWQPTVAHKAYLSKLMTHYQRSLLANSIDHTMFESALRDYSTIFKQYHRNGI